MPRRLLLALILLVAAPLVSLAWISATAAKAQEVQARERLAETLSRQLATAREPINELFADYQVQLDREITDPDLTAESLKRMRRTLPMVRQCIFINSSGQLIYPGAADLVDDEALQLLTGLVGLVDSRPATIRNRQIRREAANFLDQNRLLSTATCQLMICSSKRPNSNSQISYRFFRPFNKHRFNKRHYNKLLSNRLPTNRLPPGNLDYRRFPRSRPKHCLSKAGRQLRQAIPTPPLQNSDVQVLTSEESFEPANGVDNNLGQQTAAQPATSAWQQWFMAGGRAIGSTGGPYQTDAPSACCCNVAAGCPTSWLPCLTRLAPSV